MTAPARPVDRLLALIGLVMSSPLAIVLALAIMATSRGPVLYRAERIGCGGRRFTMLKFRTMRSLPSGSDRRITGNHDVRVFGVGRWLRRFKLDELPQLINIVRGDMAFVGPRPEDPSIVVEHYTPLMFATLDVPPGLTSPGSLWYYAAEPNLPHESAAAEATYLTDLLPQKVALDLVYVEHRSGRYDLELVVCSLAALLGVHRIFKRRQEWERAEAARRLPALGTPVQSAEEAMS